MSFYALVKLKFPENFIFFFAKSILGIHLIFMVQKDANSK